MLERTIIVDKYKQNRLEFKGNEPIFNTKRNKPNR